VEIAAGAGATAGRAGAVAVAVAVAAADTTGDNPRPETFKGEPTVVRLCSARESRLSGVFSPRRAFG
jgi:hypothetical protein